MCRKTRGFLEVGKSGCRCSVKKKWGKTDRCLVGYSFFFFAFFPFFLPITVYHSSSSSSSQSSSSSHSSSSLTFFHLESIAPRDSNKTYSKGETIQRNAFFIKKEDEDHFMEKKDIFLSWWSFSPLFFPYMPKKAWNRVMNRGTCEVLARAPIVWSFKVQMLVMHINVVGFCEICYVRMASSYCQQQNWLVLWLCMIVLGCLRSLPRAIFHRMQLPFSLPKICVCSLQVGLSLDEGHFPREFSHRVLCSTWW